MPRPAPRSACLLLASALLVLASGCDWGNRSLTFNRSFLETDQAVRTVLKHEPSEKKDGFTQYGSDKAYSKDAIKTAELSFILMTIYEDVLVRVKAQGPARTKVSVKYRRSESFIFNDRDRLSDHEKEVLVKVGRALGEPTPYDNDVEVLALLREKRLKALLAMGTKTLKDHLEEIPAFGADAYPVIPSVVRLLDLYPQDATLKARAALAVRTLAGGASAGDQQAAEAMPLTIAGRGIAKLPLDNAKNAVSKLLSGDFASHAVALLATAQNPDLSGACKERIEDSLNKLGPEFIKKVNEALANEGNAARAPNKSKAQADTPKQE